MKDHLEMKYLPQYTGCEAKVAWQLRRAGRAEAALEGKILTPGLVVEALERLQEDICPGNNVGTSPVFFSMKGARRGEKSKTNSCTECGT